jgi:hypothetical protein
MEGSDAEFSPSRVRCSFEACSGRGHYYHICSINDSTFPGGRSFQQLAHYRYMYAANPSAEDAHSIDSLPVLGFQNSAWAFDLQHRSGRRSRVSCHHSARADTPSGTAPLTETDKLTTATPFLTSLTRSPPPLSLSLSLHSMSVFQSSPLLRLELLTLHQNLPPAPPPPGSAWYASPLHLDFILTSSPCLGVLMAYIR